MDNTTSRRTGSERTHKCRSCRALRPGCGRRGRRRLEGHGADHGVQESELGRCPSGRCRRALRTRRDTIELGTSWAEGRSRCNRHARIGRPCRTERSGGPAGSRGRARSGWPSGPGGRNGTNRADWVGRDRRNARAAGPFRAGRARWCDGTSRPTRRHRAGRGAWSNRTCRPCRSRRPNGPCRGVVARVARRHRVPAQGRLYRYDVARHG